MQRINEMYAASGQIDLPAPMEFTPDALDERRERADNAMGYVADIATLFYEDDDWVQVHRTSNDGPFSDHFTIGARHLASTVRTWNFQQKWRQYTFKAYAFPRDQRGREKLPPAGSRAIFLVLDAESEEAALAGFRDLGLPAPSALCAGSKRYLGCWRSNHLLTLASFSTLMNGLRRLTGKNRSIFYNPTPASAFHISVTETT